MSGDCLDLAAAAPPVRLMLATLRPPDGTTRETVRRLLESGVTVEEVDRLSLDHGVASTLRRFLLEEVADLLPGEGEILRRRLRAHARWCLLLARELLAIDEACRGAAIPLTVLKGPLLATMLHGDPAARSSGDLDLQIDPRHLPAAARLLADRGYRPDPVLSAAIPAAAGCGVRGLPDQIPFTSLTGFLVELHLTPLRQDWMGALVSGFERRTMTVTFFDRELQTLGLGDLAIYLAVHGTKHGWGRLCLVADMAAFIHRFPAIDWGRVADDAQRRGAGRMLGAGALLASRMLEAPLPPSLEHLAGQDRKIVALADGWQARLLANSPAEHGGGSVPNSLKTWRGWWPRWRFLLLFLTVPRRSDLDWVRVSPAWFPLYRLLRPLRLVMRALRGTAAR